VQGSPSFRVFGRQTIPGQKEMILHGPVVKLSKIRF
jgi:hypothetical protein